VSLARQQAAQATFDLEEVQARERDAQVALAESIGILPTEPLRVVDFSKFACASQLGRVCRRGSSIEPWNKGRTSWRKSPFIGEKEANVRRARTAYYPTLTFQGEAGDAFGRAQLNLEGNTLPWASAQQPVWDVGITLSWPIFEGGARKRKLEIARSEREAARRDLDDTRDKAISQVWRFYTDTKLAIRRLGVAAALVDASEKSYEQTFEAYQNGLSSLVDVLAARRELSQARYTQLETRATLLESTAALAFASGDLGPQLLNRTAKTMSNRP